MTDRNIEFKTEFKFDDCKHKTHLKFDFYIPSKKLCIEFNGLQHYKVVSFFGGEESYQETIKRDKIKEEYCKSNDIKLLTIKYNLEKERVKEIIYQYLS